MSHEAIADLLELVGDPIEVAAVARFVAGEAFVPDRSGAVPVSYVGDDFNAFFFGLVEEDVPAAQLNQWRLVKGSIDAPIFAALGGPERASVALAHVHQFLRVADRSKWFFFYVADLTGSLWAVDVYWRDDGWDIEAYSVTYPRGWRGGGHIVSGRPAAGPASS